jgi:hypothetical protein
MGVGLSKRGIPVRIPFDSPWDSIAVEAGRIE